MIVFSGYPRLNRLGFRTSLNEASMPSTDSRLPLLGGRLSVDFANASASNTELSWEHLILLPESTDIVSSERGAHLLSLPQSDLQAAQAILQRACGLGSVLRKVFAAMIRKQRILAEWIAPINEILRITEGHDELVGQDNSWKIEFVAREGGLDWLLAAVARSGAEIVAEGARLRVCANPSCCMFFYDNSRTRRRRWYYLAVLSILSN